LKYANKISVDHGLRIMTAIACSAFALFGMSAATPMQDAKAQSSSSFGSYLQEVRQKALQQGVRAQTLDQVLPGLTYNPRVIQLDQSQPGGSTNSAIPPFAPYQQRHITSQRIANGKAAYRRLFAKLIDVERETGVPGPIIMAIYVPTWAILIFPARWQPLPMKAGAARFSSLNCSPCSS
jgi:membrane-bound lytic murein transglycosylase B